MPDAHGAAPVGDTHEWYTPPEFFDRLGMGFDLDPASPGVVVVPWVPVIQHVTRAMKPDGLDREWRGRVWLNPPYGPLMPMFIRKLVEHGNGVALVYSRTETEWWQHAAPRADLVCFLRDRIHFIRSDGFQQRSQMGSALLAFGKDCAGAVRRADLGWTAVSGA